MPRTGRVAAWLEDTAEAFDEIGEIDLAIDWAKQATDFGRGHQSLKAADFWCKLLDEHRPDESLEARLLVFRRWPSSTTAARLHKAAGTSWPNYRDEVIATLASSPSDAVLFALLTLKDVQFAWNLAHSLALDSDRTWAQVRRKPRRASRTASAATGSSAPQMRWTCGMAVQDMSSVPIARPPSAHSVREAHNASGHRAAARGREQRTSAPAAAAAAAAAKRVRRRSWWTRSGRR
ncbi:MAG: hypothetical protein ABJC62_08625 [Frankiaceae bacterium]